MAKYCKCMIDIGKEDILTVLSNLGRQYFRAFEAHEVLGTSRDYNIDCGENDVRAIRLLDDMPNFIAFTCRYDQDLQRTENKIAQFAKENAYQLLDYNEFYREVIRPRYNTAT